MACAEPSRIPHPGLPFRSFVLLIAGLMAVNAASIDVMLPALPHIGAAFPLEDDNHRQWVISVYLLGFGSAQLLYGTLSDRFGRKPILLISLIAFSASSLFVMFAPTFNLLLVARLLQGIASAGPRVVTVSVIRDCYTGRQMARVMSLAQIIFLAVPIIAPSFGQLMMLVAPWPWIFGALAAFGAFLALTVALRLPETMPSDHQLPMSVSRILNAFRTVLTNRITVSYIVGQGLMQGAIFGYLNSVQQVYADVFRVYWFTLLVGVIGGSIAMAAFVNSRVVVLLGMRKVSHTAILVFTVLSAANLSLAIFDLQTVWSFTILQCLAMFCHGLIASNFQAMAMEPLGRIAGTASSVQGSMTITIGASIGFVTGQHFNGTTVPLLLSYTFIGFAVIGVVWLAEGRLFRPHTHTLAR